MIEFLCRTYFKPLSQFQSHDENDLVFIRVSIVEMCYAFGLVFFVCELGQRLTNAFESNEDTFERFDWHLFSNELLKMLHLIRRNA